MIIGLINNSKSRSCFDFGVASNRKFPAHTVYANVAYRTPVHLFIFNIFVCFDRGRVWTMAKLHDFKADRRPQLKLSHTLN
jgi:hypothetical protein